MMNTYIWTKPKYTRSGVREIVGIKYNPYNTPAKEVLKQWVLPEYWHQCYAKNQKIK